MHVTWNGYTRLIPSIENNPSGRELRTNGGLFLFLADMTESSNHTSLPRIRLFSLSLGKIKKLSFPL